MQKPMLFLNMAWMRAYAGSDGDTPEGHFAFLKEGIGIPHEAFNFVATKGQCYGYAPVQNGYIGIGRLGAPEDAQFIDNVLVVWTAPDPTGGRRLIVGWYDGARVYAEARKRPRSREMRNFRDQIHYSVVAPASQCRLLSLDERVFPVPIQKKGFPGQAPAFFPDQNSPSDWVASVRKYIEKGEVATSTETADDPSSGRAVDPEHRAKVEKSAIDLVTKHYRHLGYQVSSREKDNIGWDLEAQRGGARLRIEVKGLTGADPLVEVTPNEYKAMTSRKFQPSYRFCIVTNALSAARHVCVRVFAFDDSDGAWVDDNGGRLNIVERVAARISVTESAVR